MRNRTYLTYAIVAALLIGLLDSGFLSYKHFFQPLAICGVGLFSDCGMVLQSKYSVMFGLPLAVWGIVQYLAVMALYGISQVMG
ncbi:hypothetical protein KBD81_01495, partial [Candidatus Woesebacteria bacterium]|nr:hypothetical protein [Candidatus Woesebacteria bacterium]